MSDRHDYSGRVCVPCKECGGYFIYQRSHRNFAQICARCVRKICDEPWNRAFQIYRALRPDEDIVNNGFRAKNPNAHFHVAVHVQSGSEIDTQYISMTSSIEVAAFFAVKGYHYRRFYHERDIPRIAVLDAPYDCEDRFSALDKLPVFLDFQTARNYARAFKELVYTEEETNAETEVVTILHLDPDLLEEFEGHISSFIAFRAHYENSRLALAIRNSLNTTTLWVGLDLVGLHHYAQQRPANIEEVRLVPEDENARDPYNAIRVEAFAGTDSSPIGHLSKEHSSAARRLLQHSNNCYSVLRLPDLRPGWETRIILAFDLPKSVTPALEDNIKDVCGRTDRPIDVWVK